MSRLLSRWLLVVVGAMLLAPIPVEAEESALSEEEVPLQVEEAPKRPWTVGLGPAFLGTGPIGSGFELPGGAVWQPQLLIWGTLRTAVQSFDPFGSADTRVSEWVNQVNVFGQVAVSQTERIVVGLRPLDDEGEFSGCRWKPRNECINALSADVEILFGEANFGELVPKLAAEWAFNVDSAIGRQPLLFQDGFLIADTIDAIAVARNNIELPMATNTRVSAIFGWNNVHRDDNVEDKAAKLAALFIETDFASTTANFDIAYVHSNSRAGRSIHAGLSFIQRIVWVYTSFRALISHNFDGESSQASNGALLFAELDWVPPHTHNNLYLNVFVGIDEFSSAARGPATGGPLGRTGILFGAVGIGSYAAPLGNGVGDAAGAALGYQMFFAGNRRSLTVEVGGRDGWGDSERSGVAMGFRLEQAIGRRVIARTDGFAGHRGNGNLGWGARVELLLKF